MKLSVHLLSWNSSRYIPYLFASLRAQTFKDWSLVVIDNASKDATVALIKKELAQFPVACNIIENKTNVGFAPGHNQALQSSTAQYVLLLNHDMVLQPDCFEKMVQFLDANPQAAAVSPRLMKWDFKIAGNDLQGSLGGQIDALGLKIFRNRQVIEQYTQRSWETVKQTFKTDILEVFGVSGAFPMLRLSAIKQVAFADGTLFDETYESYKEDVDLAYRLQEQGLKSYVLLNVVAHHDRSGAGPEERSDSAAALNKKSQPEWVRYHSYKNHLRTLYKNEYWQNLSLDFPWIVWYELKKFIYFLLRDRAVLKGLRAIWNKRADLRAKRQYITSLRKVSWRELRKWWTV